MSSTILLADDSVTIRKVVELTFMDEDYDLRSVGSGSEALDTVSDSIDLVITDIHMPGADGYEVCQTVKERFPGKPVLLLVGTFESFDEDRAREVGADDHLKKPFDSQELLGKVRNLLSGASGRSEFSQRIEEKVEDQPVDPVDGIQRSGDFDTAQIEPNVDDSSVSWAAGPSASQDAMASSTAESEVEVAPAGAPFAESVETPAEAEVPLELSDATVDRIARRVVELLSEESIRDVAWEVIPDLAEVVIKERLHELETYADQAE